jgi:LmbE family N-acetylglucosaminyl deacetylase
MSTLGFPDHTTLVMAHPDDEALWATSILSRMDRIVFCFEAMPSSPTLGEGRRRSLAEFPLPNVTSLGFQESEVFNSAAWPEPVEADYGLAVRRNRGSMPGFSESRYRETHGQLVAALRPLLTRSPSVITHNPWGEYGHADHVQVFRAVADLQREIAFTLWVSSYVSNKSYPLMLRHLPRLDCGAAPYPTDPELGARLQAFYTRNGCWTWFEDHIWPARESFYRWLGPGETPVPLHAGSFVNMIWLDWAARPDRQPPLRRLLRRAARLLHQ